MENSVAVSVFVLSYNEEDYIRQAMDSIINQKTNFNYEIICFDDSSCDKTPQILKEYAAKNENVILALQSENQCSKGYNVTLEFMYPLARGKYIAYCDGDDYWTELF